MTAEPTTRGQTAPAQTPATDGLRVTGLRVVVESTGDDVVDEITFAVGAGEVLGLVGESGSGKTTAALALLGYARRGLRIDGGTVEVDGRDVLTLDEDALAQARGRTIAYVPQDPASALNPALRVGTQLTEALAPTRRGRRDPSVAERIAQLLTEVRLDGAADILRKYPHQLSGGQQQRIGIAMAFAARPRVIVLDEPTTGLDVSTQRVVLATVADLCRSYGVAAVYVSHDLAVVSEITTSVAVLYGGRLVEIGSTAEIFERPSHPYTRGLLRAAPSLGEAHVLEGIGGEPPRPGSRPTGCTFAPRCPFVIDACRAAEPPLIPAHAHGGARCVRLEEVAATVAADRVGVTRPEPSTASDATPVLAVTSLAARYGDHEVLRDINLSVARSSCVAVVGESGCGKTTLARCIAGQHSQWSGEVALDGTPLAQRVGDRDREALRRIQYIFQSPYNSLNPRRTVEQAIEEPLRQFGVGSREERGRRTRAILDEVALSQRFRGLYPGELSGGERQRVAIARALAVEPELLVCDEVTSALDVSVQATIIELLRELQERRGVGVLFITHSLGVVRSVADEVVVLLDGHVVERGPTTSVLDAPQQAYTAQLLADTPGRAAGTG
jgi:peptide/nickel transport system ATP-binding protein